VVDFHKNVSFLFMQKKGPHAALYWREVCHARWSSSCSPCALVKNEETHILTMNQENGDASWSMGFTYPG
jgi:hypothetical protein